MRKTKRTRRILSVFTAMMLLVLTLWTPFAYAESEDYVDSSITDVLEQESIQEEATVMTEEEAAVMTEEEAAVVTEEEAAVVTEEEAAVVTEEQAAVITEEEPVNILEKNDENTNQDIKEFTALDVEKTSTKVDPNPGSGLGILPNNPDVPMNEHPDIGDTCQVSKNMFESVSLGTNIEYWGDFRVMINVYDTEYGSKFDFTVVDENSNPVKISALYVKGGSNGGYLYDYRTSGASNDTGLHTPITGGSGKYADISHIVFYYCPPQTPPEQQKTISVKKVWKNSENNIIENTSIFPEVKVKIDFKDEGVEDILLTLSQENQWMNKAENINTELEYIVVEEAVTGLPQGYTLAGEPEITEECVPVVSEIALEKIKDDDDIECLYTITNKVNYETFNFQGTISGLKYNDIDKDGYHDVAEPVVSGVTIYLYDVNPNQVTGAQPLAVAVTDQYGVFSFQVTVAGTYYLREVQVAGWTQSAPLDNLFMITLSELNNKFPESFTADQAYQNIIQQYAKDQTGQLFDVAFIFANYENSSEPPTDKIKTAIEGHKFNDLNTNGVWDENELGLQGWEITLWKYLGDMDESGTLTVADLEKVGTKTTDTNGYYEFVEVKPGETYYVSENIFSQANWIQTYPVDGPVIAEMGRTNKILGILAEQTISGVNFGNYYQAPSSGGGGSSGGGSSGGSSSGGSSSGGSSSGGSSTTTLVETFDANEMDIKPEVITLSMPVFSAEEEAVLEPEVMAVQEVEDPDANPQTSDPGLTSQFAGLGLSIAAMFALKRRSRR